jgi:hypothetical protein
MNIKQFFSKWSRTIHRWVGLYFALVISIYLTEMFILPSMFSAGLPIVDGKPPAQTIKGAETLLSLEQAQQAFWNQNPAGIHSPNEIDKITFLPASNIYQFEDTDQLFEWYIDARDGKILKYGFNVTDFLEYRGLLGWLSPLIHNVVEMSFLFFMTTLAITGVYLFIYPFLLKKPSGSLASVETPTIQKTES